MAKKKCAKLTADLIKRVPTRIIGPDGTIDNVFAFVSVSKRAA